MQAFEKFKDMDASFWAFVKFVSENLGYTERRAGRIKKYSIDEIINLCEEKSILTSDSVVRNTALYSKMRADLLNGFAEQMLMDADSACREFQDLYRVYTEENYLCKIPLNKQKGAMKQVAFFTAIINILTEKTLREITNNTDTLMFDDDPRSLAYFWDDRGGIVGASSRRFDGAFPSINNPLAIWEIKEYYYATTFGSRVADGVYETQLDGFEFKDIYDRTGIKTYHVLFVDSHRTWWVQGKSYLCRLIDAMNSGIVDEVIVGREVLTRWPEILYSLCEEKK